jgi:hypothetical protein
MNRARQLSFASLGAAMLLSMVSVQPAAARIRCQGEFQVTRYGLIATPYCGDEEIARVANSYGWHVTAVEVHNNPLTNVYLCQTIGYDWRLQSPCAGYLIHGGGAH